MTAAMWVNNVKVAVETKMVSNPLPVREGALWTNGFLS